MNVSEDPLKYLLSFLVLISLGCDGQQSGSFFEDPPDCYYDSLFGCGTFDIPGNSSYYGYANKKASSFASGRTRNSIGGNYSGNWSGALTRKSSSCNFVTPSKINGSFQISQKKDRISMKIPLSSNRSISLRGKSSSKGIQTSGTGFISLCSYSADTNIISKNTHKGQLDLQLKVRCLFQDTCALRYVGSIAR